MTSTVSALSGIAVRRMYMTGGCAHGKVYHCGLKNIAYRGHKRLSLFERK